MIILLDKNMPKAKFLLPMPKSAWRTPSHAQYKCAIGNENQTRFKLNGRSSDGVLMWRGWFDDREDADAFLFAMATGSLQYERALWDLPTPAWRPDIGENLTYQFVTITYLTTTGSNQTYTSPSDWNNSDNTVEVIGGGGGGKTGGALAGSGGGGGGYSKISNFSFATPGTTTATYRIGSGGSGGSTTAAGGDTYFNDTAMPAAGTDNAKCAAKGGDAGLTGTTTVPQGGASSSGYGQTRYSGGNSSGSETGWGGRGGGGAAGPRGNGGSAGQSYPAGIYGGSGGGGAGGGGSGTNGGNSTVPNSANGTAGGNNSAGSGTVGSGGTSGSVNGGAGTLGAGGGGGYSTNNGTGGTGGASSSAQDWDSTHGAGGGGGGSGSGSSAYAAGASGSYGGGGGGGSLSGNVAGTGSSGAQGIIVIQYTPATKAMCPNIPMLGM